MLALAGNRKIILIAAIALAVGLISLYMIRSIQQATEDKITIELQENTNTKREVIRDAVRRNSASSDTDDAWGLRYLQSR